MLQTVKEIYGFDEFRLDVSEERLLLCGNEPVPLPEKAFEILRVLVENAGHLVGKDELLNEVWAGAFVEENNLDKNISLLRRALGEKKGGKKFIETVRGHGYRFVAKVRRTEAGKGRKAEEEASDAPIFLSSSRQTRRAGNVVALAKWRREAKENEAPNENSSNVETEFNPAHVEEKKLSRSDDKN